MFKALRGSNIQPRDGDGETTTFVGDDLLEAAFEALCDPTRTGKEQKQRHAVNWGRVYLIRPRYKKRAGVPSDWAAEWGAHVGPLLKKWNSADERARAHRKGTLTLDHCELVEVTVVPESAQTEYQVSGAHQQSSYSVDVVQCKCSTLIPTTQSKLQSHFGQHTPPPSFLLPALPLSIE